MSARDVLIEHASLHFEHERNVVSDCFEHRATIVLAGSRLGLVITSEHDDRAAAEDHLVEVAASSVAAIHEHTKRILAAAGVVHVDMGAP